MKEKVLKVVYYKFLTPANMEALLCENKYIHIHTKHSKIKKNTKEGAMSFGRRTKCIGNSLHR